MKHTEHLRKDKVLRVVIEKFGELPALTTKSDVFVSIIGSIVSQQLSTKAADTIWKRFETLFTGKVTPQSVLETPEEKIREVGVSYSKIKYMKGLSQMILSGDLDLEKLVLLPESEFIAQLTKVKGIGPWTAEMILMFTLGREDIFSLGDLGLRNAVSQLYNIDRDDIISIEKLSHAWSPYRTYAALYLWKSLDNK